MIDPVHTHRAALLHAANAVRATGTDEPRKSAPVANAQPSAISNLSGRGAPVDISLVTAVRQAIADSRYAVDADAIAARIVDDILTPGA